MNLEKIRDILREWYFSNKRTLPWRETTDPYRIWISEIILQQTRVNQGFEYYIRFLERFPSVEALASASEDEVLKYWQGLGYYSRARNLHKASKQIMKTFEGKFPRKFEDVLGLSGVGSYTASAICSFAYKQAYAVLDGNVFRVLSRLYGSYTPINTGKGQKEFNVLANDLLDVNSPHTHNQAIMEFGALQCTPKKPHCEICPLLDCCNAYRYKMVTELPVKQGKTTITNRYFNYFFIRNNEFTYLQKRDKRDIWQNLYEFPLIETEQDTELVDVMNLSSFKELFFNDDDISVSNMPFKIKHVLSHRIIFAKFYFVNIAEESSKLKSMIKVKSTAIDSYAVSRLIEIFLEENNFSFST